jgi:membrane protein implicated in regulation of membrane protease activity
MQKKKPTAPPVRRSPVRDRALSIVAGLIFVTCLFGQSLTGWRVYNDDQKEHGGETVGYAGYFLTGHFVEATFENWESEFLQMGMFVFLTAFLVQKGSAESKKPEDEDGGEEQEEEEDGERRARRDGSDAPWPVRRGGWVLKIYENSLSLAFFILFLIAFALHAMGGATEYNQEQLAHGAKAVSTLAFLATSQFWFESFQNWQSEFLAVLAMVVLSIFLRQKGSPESKPVEKPVESTGSD